jgi:hypothetical protein
MTYKVTSHIIYNLVCLNVIFATKEDLIKRTASDSVSNGSTFPGHFRVRFHPKPDRGDGSYHMQNPLISSKISHNFTEIQQILVRLQM